MEAEGGLNCTAAIMTSGPLLSMTGRAITPAMASTPSLVTAHRGVGTLNALSVGSVTAPRTGGASTQRLKRPVVLLRREPDKQFAAARGRELAA